MVTKYELPYSGVECDEKKCKIFFAATIEGKIEEAIIEVPVNIPIKPSLNERVFEDILKDSKILI